MGGGCLLAVNVNGLGVIMDGESLWTEDVHGWRTLVGGE